MTASRAPPSGGVFVSQGAEPLPLYTGCEPPPPASRKGLSMSVPHSDALLRLHDQHILPDGRIRFTIEREDGRSLTVSCPWAEVADIVQFLCALAKDATEQLGISNDPKATPHLVRLPASRIGFAPDAEMPDITLMIIGVGGLPLAFQIPNSDLVRLADEFSRNAKTLSAPTSRKN